MPSEANVTQRLLSRVRAEGIWGLMIWPLRWLYWHTPLYQLGWHIDRTAKNTKPPVCESVKDWIVKQPSHYLELVSPQDVFVRTPVNTIEPTLPRYFGPTMELVIPERYIGRIPQATIVGNDGLIVLPDGKFVLEQLYGVREHLEASKSYSAWLPQPVLRKSGNFYSLVALWVAAGNYYHWMHDALAGRLYAIFDLLPDDIQFIVPARLSGFQIESLRLLGIRDEQLCRFSHAEAWECESLFFASPAAISGFTSPVADRWLRDRILTACNISPSAKGRRIYISRRQAKSRGVVNEDEVEHLLGQYGFETWVPENLPTLRDQVALFAEAEAIVSVHGAGLTNMLFAPAGTTILEMFEPEYTNHCYWNLSNSLGHKYWFLWGDSIHTGRINNDVRVPMDRLARTVELALSPRQDSSAL